MTAEPRRDEAEECSLNSSTIAEAGIILIPVKGFKAAKQRLASVLSLEERSAFARAMLEDVLCSITAGADHPRVALITGDSEAQQLAARFGLEIIEDREVSGETQAVAMATRVCIERGATSILVIPGDIPLVEAREIQVVLSALPEPPETPGVVLVPAHDGRGTNAALLRPPGLVELRFGNDSFEPHLRAARESSQLCEILRLRGIGLDIDNPAELAQLLKVETRTESQKLLRSWKVPERLQSMSERRQAWRTTN
jgi:2-phospho-L-lactate/phosphoenolpyruvate guanylyltransferase